MSRRTRKTLLIVAAVLLVLALAIFLRSKAPPEAARLLPESDGIIYFNLKAIRTLAYKEFKAPNHVPEYQQFIDAMVNPVGHIAALCKDRGILLHLEASHVLGKLFFELEDAGADFISWSGETLHAPQGTGALYVRKGVNLDPYLVGGLEQGGHRAGTFNVAGLAALGEASRELIEARDYMCTEIARLRNKFEEGIQSLIPDAKALFTDQQRVPHITAIAFPGVINEALLYSLNRRNICACIGGGSFQQIGLVLKACGEDDLIAHSAVSFSLSRETTEEQIDRAINIVAEVVSQLRQTSQSFREPL